QSLRYLPVPGEWERKSHPQWSDAIFEVPPDRDGEVHYVTKGHFVRLGGTALVERLPSGHVIKSVLRNPYSPIEEQENRQKMEREIEIYRLLRPTSYIPRLIDFDIQSCTLTLENQVNGDLENYIKEHNISLDIQRKWIQQAVSSVSYIHLAGVVHTDLTPRNFLVDADCNLLLCDFAGSLLHGRSAFTGSLLQGQPVFAGCPGSRYQSRHWRKDYIPTCKDDIFALGSVIYLIEAGEEPYNSLPEYEVTRRFQNRLFPETGHLLTTSIIQGCWQGKFSSADEAMKTL
ncbi:kinase-like domain-containing protein, partial [Stachybotrys elegans]